MTFDSTFRQTILSPGKKEFDATIWENIIFPKAPAPVYMDDPSYRLAAMKIPRRIGLVYKSLAM